MKEYWDVVTKLAQRKEHLCRNIVSTSFLLILGIGLGIVSVFLFPWPLATAKSDISYYSKGFVFGTSEEIVHNRSEILMEFSNFQRKQSKVDVSIKINVVNLNTSEHNFVFYLLQVPFIISDVEVDYFAWYPALYGGYNFSVQKDNLSYVLVAVPKENVTFGVSRNIRFDFSIDSLLSKRDYFSHEGILTFSNSYDPYADDIEQISNIAIYGDRLYYFLAQRSILDVERPRSYEVTETIPTPDNTGYWDGKMWFRYDLKDRTSPSMSSTVVSIDFEDPQIKYNCEMRKSLTWLFLGTGIPAGIASWTEILKVGIKKFIFFKHKQILLTGVIAIIVLVAILIGILIWVPLS